MRRSRLEGKDAPSRPGVDVCGAGGGWCIPTPRAAGGLLSRDPGSEFFDLEFGQFPNLRVLFVILQESAIPFNLLGEVPVGIEQLRKPRQVGMFLDYFLIFLLIVDQ